MKTPNSPTFQIIINVHNLMINHDDVPNDGEWVLNENGERVYHRDGEWYIFSDFYLDDNCRPIDTPLLWYDIPQFDIDRIELEKLSKEEQIELVIKERGKKNDDRRI